MTARAFRRIALGLENAVESAHMGHPDFRVANRIFASLQGTHRGMVKLTPAQQERFVADDPDAFAPEDGAWGRQGFTRVYLAHAEAEQVGEALTLAWQNAHAPPAARRAKRRR